MWLFQICNANTGNDKEVEERNTCSYTDPVQLCYFFPSIKFPAVICIVLHLQSAGEPLGVHVQRGHNTLAERLGEKQEKTHQISSPGVHGRVHISIPMRRRSDSQSCGSSLPPMSEGGGGRHLEDMKHI